MLSHGAGQGPPKNFQVMHNHNHNDLIKINLYFVTLSLSIILLNFMSSQCYAEFQNRIPMLRLRQNSLLHLVQLQPEEPNGNAWSWSWTRTALAPLLLDILHNLSCWCWYSILNKFFWTRTRNRSDARQWMRPISWSCLWVFPFPLMTRPGCVLLWPYWYMYYLSSS